MIGGFLGLVIASIVVIFVPEVNNWWLLWGTLIGMFLEALVRVTASTTPYSTNSDPIGDMWIFPVDFGDFSSSSSGGDYSSSSCDSGGGDCGGGGD